MISLRDLTASQRTLLGVGAASVVAALLVLLSASDLDLTAFRTLRAVHVNGAGNVVETRYNPIAIVGLALIGVAILGALGLVFASFLRLLPKFAGGILGAPSDALAQAGQKLDQELGKVLGHIRAHITTNESYAKSLASAQSRLSGLSEGEQVRVIVSLLVAENERMRQDSGLLQSRLEDSQKQIQSLRSSLSQAEAVVLKDPLTGAGNRRQFDVTMEKAVLECERNGTTLSLIMCDIDHFKRVNDAFGHQVGDELIRMFARVIEGSVRDADTVIRYGGEEFAIVLPQTEQEAARSIAERIRRQFESKRLTIRETSQKIGQLTASFGVAEYRPGDDVETLVQRADAKLYDAKSSGRNRVASFGHGDD
ncbi:GGDEF domain-containing protein [Hyphomicrobium sp.]|uniref:GGDEF domain-containing protein n=1 Tax=Hyphomicrobium sp. TaxID=82 RepID=UPI0025C2AC01|nr:GGDEF domain-containing protein [Hyphomicrobium sp.]MCC7252453.1 GGDEF domain-containing protein [Hyphomicrobium sp.]